MCHHWVPPHFVRAIKSTHYEWSRPITADRTGKLVFTCIMWSFSSLVLVVKLLITCTVSMLAWSGVCIWKVSHKDVLCLNRCNSCQEKRRNQQLWVGWSTLALLIVLNIFNASAPIASLLVRWHTLIPVLQIPLPLSSQCFPGISLYCPIYKK